MNRSEQHSNDIKSLLDEDKSSNPIADDVANYLFSMSKDPNHKANIALKKHFEDQAKVLKSKNINDHDQQIDL